MNDFCAEDYATARATDTFKFNLNKLYSTICKIPNTDEITLLLYMLLHRNSSVKQDIMRRPDIQLLASNSARSSSLCDRLSLSIFLLYFLISSKISLFFCNNI